MRREQGFTLLELVVAVAIVAVMFTFATLALKTSLDSNEVSQREAKRLTELQKAMWVISRDITQAVDRPIRDAFSDQVEAMRGGGSFGSLLLELTRTGRSNPAAWQRSHMQRVAYVLDDDKLVRMNWIMVDQGSDAEPMETPLMEKVESVELRFLDHSQQWQEFWPLPDDGSGEQAALPLAIELNIELEDWGRITRLYPVAGAAS